MLRAKELMDSRRFNLVADQFCAIWKKRSSSDEDREFVLGQLLDFLEPDEPVTASDAIAKEVAKRKANRAPEAVDADTPLTDAEAEAIRASVKPVTEDDIQAAIDKAVAQAIKPMWNTAPTDPQRMAKKFTVKAVRDGVQLSMQQDRWQKALQKAGLNSTVSFAYAGLPLEAGGSGDVAHHIVYVG